MDDQQFLRCANLAREKFIDPAVRRALKDEAAPLPPLIFAQFFSALAVLSTADKAKAFERYRELSELALRKFLINRNLGEDGRASEPS